ncbi:UDP-glucose 4-epimerase [Posidoniimonas polymericola]|uniref:UDP-glucose 4-epimerase n=1 Tax=Posidoniimonas polymericola TaxID=2528002 RepID=A0A5C5YQ21_9BACT|nr:UDP-glucose 4-epimerase GalE [Posidoniimonas polymericola]TWT77041.1 UDP-glucose 4-epimerase [Posidoniimonas polymericola]
MNILVTGGAGYVGSHAVKCLTANGHNVWVYDNLVYGHKAAAPADRLVVGDLHESEKLVKLFKEHDIEAVMHFAAYAFVGESVTDPAKYYQNNVVGTLSLLDAMRECGVKKIVFSSTCATYGVPQQVPIPEDHPQSPINPYGYTKLVIERAMEDYRHAYDLGYAALRYFNASGASADGSIGEDHTPETHLIPLVLDVALGKRESITVFGTDYPTPDGSCIRDYIHVDDLADAHLAALKQLEPGKSLKLNLGTGRGMSVKEVIGICEDVTGKRIATVLGERREGDPPELVANPQTAEDAIGWKAKRSMRETIESAWAWHSSHPDGFAD